MSADFFMEIIREYPVMNGPFAPSDEELAYKHGLGSFDMFDVHLDRNTVIKIPRIRSEQRAHRIRRWALFWYNGAEMQIGKGR